VLAAFRSGDGLALPPAAGALAAVLGVARPSPADLLALAEMGEMVSAVPALTLSGALSAHGAGGDCLAALGAALLRRAPGEAADDAGAQMWEPRVGAFQSMAVTVVNAATSGLEALCGSGGSRFAATTAAAAGMAAAAALVRAAADAPAAPKCMAMAATVGVLLPAIAEFLEVSARMPSTKGVHANAVAVTACVGFLHAAVAAAGPADIDAEALRRAASALCSSSTLVGGGARMLSLIALLLTRPGAHLEPLLGPVLSLSLSWAAEQQLLATELHAPLAAIHLAALRSRWSVFAPRAGTPAAGVLAARDPATAAAPRAILEHAGAVLSGAVPAAPGALRAVLAELQRCRRQVNLFRAELFVPLRPHFVHAALGAVIGRHHESLSAELAELVHALAEEDPSGFYEHALPDFVRGLPGLHDAQRGALVELLPAAARDQPSVARGLERMARDASLYVRTNRATME
jgi:hypothetical protein